MWLYTMRDTFNKHINYQRIINLNKMMPGVLSSNNSFNRRYRSPQYTAKNFIMPPSFDRGRRKISKMGGTQLNFSGLMPKISPTSPQVETQNMRSRRFTSKSPAPKPNMIANLSKTNTLNLDEEEKFNNEIYEKSPDPQMFFEIIPEVQNRKVTSIENKRNFNVKGLTKIQKKKRSQNSSLAKQNTLKNRVFK